MLYLSLLWRVLVAALEFPSAEGSMFSMIFDSFVTGITVLWLLGHKIAGRNRLVTFLFATAIMAAICLIGAASYGLTDPSEQTVITVALTLLLSLTVLLSTTLAAMLCTKRFTGPRFVLWQCLWAVVVSVLLMFQLFGAVSLFLSSPDFDLRMFFEVLIPGVVCGLCVCVIMLPYMILAVRCRFFRERLRACLRLESMQSSAQPELAVNTPEQEAAPERTAASQ